MFKPDANMTLQKYPIRIVIDPSTDAEYYSGQELEVGGGLVYDRIQNSIVYQTQDTGIIVLGRNLMQYLSPNTTYCLINGGNYNIRYISNDAILCQVPINQLTVGYHDLQLNVEHLEFQQLAGDFLVLPSSMIVEQFSVLNQSFILFQGNYHFTNGSQCVFMVGIQKYTSIPQQFGCTNQNGIKYCNQSLCQQPQGLQGQNKTLKVYLQAYMGEVTSQNFTINAKTVPTILKVHERLIIADRYRNESIYVTFDQGQLEYTALFCRFTEDSTDGLQSYSIGLPIGGSILACHITASLRQTYDHSLEISFDNLTFSEQYSKAIKFLPNHRIKSISPEYILADPFRQTRNFSILLTQPIYDYNKNLNCIITSNNRSYYGTLRTAGNLLFFKCEMNSLIFKDQDEVSIGLLYKGITVPFLQMMIEQHTVKVYPQPIISRISPKIVINQKIPPILEIIGSNLGWYQSVVFKHKQTVETQVISRSDKLIQAKLPTIVKNLKNPRKISIILQVDEDSYFTVSQKIEYVQQINITDYSLQDNQVLVQLDNQIDLALNLSYFCILGSSKINSYPLRVQANQNQNILNCKFTKLDYEAAFDELQVEYFYGSQKQVTNKVTINQITSWQLLGPDKVQSKGILLLRQVENKLTDIDQVYCSINISQSTYLSKLQIYDQIQSFGYYVDNIAYQSKVFFCLLPQIQFLQPMSGTLQLINFAQAGNSMKLLNQEFRLSDKLLNIMPQQLQRVFYSYSTKEQDLMIFIRHDKNISGIGCSLPQLLHYGIKGVITSYEQNLSVCNLKITDISQVNIKSNQRDHRGQLIDYIMLQSDVWTQYQEVPIRLSQTPEIFKFNQTFIMQSDCKHILQAFGRKLRGDYQIFLDGFLQLKWKVVNQTEAIVQGPDCSQIEDLLSTGKNVFNVEIRYNNPITGLNQSLSILRNGLTINMHQRLAPENKVINSSKESIDIKFQSEKQTIQSNQMTKDVYCTYLFNDRKTFSEPIPLNNQSAVICRLNIKRTFKQQRVEVGLSYRDGTILSTQDVIVNIQPMIISNFTISPQITHCNSKVKQSLTLKFQEPQSTQLIESLRLSNDTVLLPKSETVATASIFLPCRKNLTYYRFNLHSNQGDLLSVGRANVLTINPFRIMDIHQRNEKVYFEVDREIEFELLSKSFTIQCLIGNSSMSRVLVNEFHQFYCDYERIKVDARTLQLKLDLVRDDSTQLEIAQSFQSTQIISPQSIRAMLAKNLILSEIEESFAIEIFTDPTTLLAITKAQLACRVSSQQLCQECKSDLYFEGQISGSTITCFKGQIELANMSPLKVSLVIYDIEMNLQGDDKLTSQFVHIHDIKPSTHFFTSTISQLVLKTSHDLSVYPLNCIMVPKHQKTSGTKYIFTAIQNSTNIICPIAKQPLLEGPYWVTVGMRDSPYHLDLGKTSIQVYQRLNLTLNEPKYILTRSKDVIIEVYGHFNGLMSYYARHKHLDTIKVNFTGIAQPAGKKAYFEIFSLTNTKLNVKIIDLKELVLQQTSFISDLQLWDMEHGIKLGEVQSAFTIMDPIQISDVRPRAQFSPVDRINLTLKLDDDRNDLFQHNTNYYNMNQCIQVVDKNGSQIITQARLLNRFEYQCETYLETMNISLGIKGENSQMITRITDVHVLNKKGPITYSKIEPINGPKAGGTIVNVTGQNFLNTVPFNQAILCRFASIKVTASLVNSETIQCKSPTFSKSGPIEFSLEIQDPKDYYMVIKTIRYFYEDEIEIKQTVPNFIDLSYSMIWLEVITREPIMTRSPKSIICRLDKDIPISLQIPNQGIVQVYGEHKSSDDHIIMCPIPTYQLSHILNYRLTISGNSGANFSTSFFQLRVFPVLEIPGLLPPLLIQGRKQRQVIPMSHLDLLSGNYLCIFTSSKNLSYSFKGQKFNSTSVACDIYPIDTSYEIGGTLRIQDAEFNLTTKNSVQLKIIRDKILISKVIPSTHVHLIPNSTLTFQVYLTQIVGPKDVENGQCKFSNEINQDWLSTNITYIEGRLLYCTLIIPQKVSQQLQEVYTQVTMQLQSGRDSELFSDASYTITISRRPIITQTVPETLNNALEYQGEVGVVGQNFNVTSLCFIRYPLKDGQYFDLHSEYVNQSYIICNLTSNQLLRPLVQRKEVELAISNNKGLQYSLPFSLRFIDSQDLSISKSLHIGNYLPKFGPYQGGLTIKFEIVQNQNLSQSDIESLFCDFDSVERTQFSLINQTHGQCLQPPSRYIQAVRLRVISTDVKVTVITNFDHFFTFYADFEFLKMDPEFHLISANDTIKKVALIGKNFNTSHQYIAVLRNVTEVQTYAYELPAKQISDRELVIDVSQIKGKHNVRFKVELQIVGNQQQLTKHYPRYFYLMRQPQIRLIPSNQFVRRNSLADSFISLEGYNIQVDDLSTKCLYTLDGWNTTKIIQYDPLWIINKRTGNGTLSRIQCQVPHQQIFDGGIKPQIALSLVFKDLDHQSNKVEIPVLNEAHISRFTPNELELGKTNSIYIVGTGFEPTHPYICKFTGQYGGYSFEKALQINETFLICVARPVQDSPDAILTLIVQDQFTEQIIGETKLTFKQEETIVLSELVPRSIFHNISGAYLDVYGNQFRPDCVCFFGNVSSAETIYIDKTKLKCLVPALQIKDREVLNRTIKGFSTPFSVFCPLSRKRSTNHLSLFIKYGTRISRLSRSYIRENQFDTDNTITLRGYLFYQGQTCVLTNSSGFSFESPIKQFVDEETIVCENQGDFFIQDKENPVDISIKEYDHQNNSIVYQSNRVRLWYLPQFIIWAGFDVEKEIFYIHEDGQIVRIKTNIRKHSNFTYHCLFGIQNEYISESVYDNHTQELVGCKLPYLLEEVALNSTLQLKLQEVANDQKVSFSNNITIKIQMPPEIEWVDPKVIPAHDNGTWVIHLKGKYFITNQTRLFFDDLMVADVTVLNSDLGSFIAPKNITPGILKLRITNNLLKLPRIMRNERTLEYMMLPEIHLLLPSELPTSDVPQKVIVQGANFTSQTQCMFDGKLAVTTYLTSNLLECEAPVIFAGEEVLVQVLERSLYKNRETNVQLRYYATPYVYRVEPRYAFRTHEGTEVQVYVSNLHQITSQNLEFQFCKFGIYSVQVSDIRFIEDPKAKTNYTVFVCRTPYIPGPEVMNVEILTDNGVFSSSINNQFEFLDPPVVKHASPPIAPYGTKDIEFLVSGGPWDPAYEYFCQYREEMTYLNETKAFYSTNEDIRCVIPGENVIRHSEYVTIRIMMKDFKQTYSYMLPGTMRVLFYDPLYIIKLEPGSGDIAGGTEVYIEGYNFDVSYGGITCKFGDTIVSAMPIENFKLIKCTAPASRWSFTNEAQVSVSVDGKNYFSGQFGRQVFFSYRVPPTFDDVIPLRQSVWGERTLLVFGQNFPSKETSFVICRFIFTSSQAQIDIKGKFVTDTSLECSTPRHLLVDDLIILQVSFNNLDYYEVSKIDNTLTYSEKARIRSIFPAFGFANATKFSTSVKIEGDYFWEMEQALFGNYSSGLALHDQTDRWLNVSIPPFVNISILDNTTTYGDNRATVELANSIVGRSRDQLTYTYINYFRIIDSYPSLVNDEGDVLYLEGEGFINTPALNCRFGNLFATSVRYYNRTKISCGTPFIEDKTKIYEVGVTFNGIEYLYFKRSGEKFNFALQFTSDLQVVQIIPDLAYANELNLVINIRADGLENLDTVSCKIHNYITRGKYFEQDGFTWIQCIIPSFDFIKATSGSVQIGSDDSFIIEVSNNGKDFSNTKKRFKYIVVEQLIDIYPQTGPEKGGTVINITVADLPNIGGESGDYVDIAKCYFPGYAPQKAQWININLVQCTTPRLIENIENVTSTRSFAVAEVSIEIIGIMNAKFAFVYTKDLHINALDPYNAYIPSTQLKTPIQVRGSNFLPVEDLIQCKYHFEDPLVLSSQVNLPTDAVSVTDGQLIVVGRYINNHTIECLVPSLKIQPPIFNEVRMKVEISLNKGIQFTTDGLLFSYRHKDIMTHMYPQRGFTFGNTYLTIGYQYFYDKSSLRQVCNFTYIANQTETFSTRIISFDEDFVYCYTPPAYLISKTLAQLGGDVYVRISSNNRDFSDEQYIFRYDPVARIDFLSPVWVIKDRSIVVSIQGEFFIQTNLLQIKLVSSDGARITYVSQNTTEIMFQTTYMIQFVMPSNVFIEKDFVMVYLKFGEEFWYLAEQRLYIYSEIVLDRLRPNYAYTRQDALTRELFVYGINYWDTQKSGHLRCLLDNNLFVPAQYVNETLILCNVASMKTPGQVKIDVYISPEIKSITSLYMNFIDEPIIDSVNITYYYYHYQHRVPVKVVGRNFATNLHIDGSRRIYVRIQDTKQVRPIDVGSNFFTFDMPLGLNIGSYRISMSTDGLYYRPQEQDATQFIIQVLQCPPGKYCFQFTAQDCRPGYYCPQDKTFMEIKCPAGLYQPLAAQQTCQRCPNGTFCKEQQLTEPKACPRGYLCDKNITISLNMMTICPDGYVCPKNTTSIDIYDVKNNPNGIQLCPDGYWCAEGSFSLIPDYGLFNSPQLCRDEVVCKNELNTTTNRTTYYPGPLDQYGNYPCPRGHYCQDGIAITCPMGTLCHEEQLQAPVPCPFGQYNLKTGQTQCTLCPVGSFCMSSGTIYPTKCRPGYTCQFEGAPYPAQVCPAGSYCTSMTVTNNSFSTLQKEFKPNLCSAATYCLKGASSPIVDAGNAQAAQKCQAGTYCREGTKDPNGEGKCWPGYYCPSNSPEPLPAEPGFFSQGFGNEKQEPCRAGTYQDEFGTIECKYCPKGSECPDQQMRWHSICKAGGYSQFTSQTECTKCPAGTFSNEIGIDNINKCKDCLAKFYCPDPGINSMQKAIVCQEGQYCVLRTTSEVMFSSNCWSGYYSDFRSSGLEDFFLCDPGFYCTSGTSKTKYKQNNCLQGFYCPRGTAAEISMETGKFIESKVFQVQKDDIIRAIEGMLRSTRPVVNNFDQRGLNNNYNQMALTLKLRQSEYTNRSLAGELEKNLTSLVVEIGVLSRDLDNMWWLNSTYNYNVTYLQRREDYLNELKNEKECVENKILPIELRVAYFQMGKNLKCPNGTTSNRGSQCLGQCYRKQQSNIAISIMDPVNVTLKINSGDESDYDESKGKTALTPSVDSTRKLRILQSLQPVNRTLQTVNNAFYVNDDDWINVIDHQIQPEEFKSTYDFLRTYLLRPLEIAKILLDFRSLPRNFFYNDHFAVVVLDKDDKIIDLPYYFDPDNNDKTNKKANLEIRVFNWREYDVQFKVAIYLYHGLFQPYLTLLKNKVNVVFYNANRQRMYSNVTWAMFVSKSITEGITLPYNMPDWGKEPDFYVDMTARGSDINPVRRPIDKDVYDSTYWDAQLISANIMPWLPYFSNCEGQDQRIVLFDAVEYHEKCILPRYQDIKVVNPIPSTGLDPIADECKIILKCIYDEPVFQPIAQSTRWYAIREAKELFYITREPVGIDRIREIDPFSASGQTAYANLINDGSDELLTVTFYPDISAAGFPGVVEVNINYYQESKDIKRIAEVTVYFKNYTQYKQDDLTVVPGYQLHLNYQALSYFDLINTFQFSIPIYIVLFICVSIIQILLIIIFWLFTFIFCPCMIHFKRSPSLRFTHMARVLFKQPAVGTMMANICAMIVAGLLKVLQDNSWFDNIVSDWSNWGLQIDPAEQVLWKRGRLGLALIIISSVFMFFGSDTMIHSPTKKDEKEIVDEMKAYKKRSIMEMSFDDSDGEKVKDEEVILKEHDENISEALTWKRRHLFVNSFFTAIFFMIKIEFSYTNTFGQNIITFQILFAILDIFIEQLLTRLIMGEALMVTPCTAMFTSIEFVMTMGANDFQSFIFSYFAELGIALTMRTYVGPIVEIMELKIQQSVIKLSQRFKIIEQMFKGILQRQLNMQLQLINLAEYHEERKDERTGYKNILEKGEGMEALLGSVATYASNTQSLLVVPFVLAHIILFANETKIPQGYAIAQRELPYYLTFSCIIIFPQMIVDIFLLHLLEVIWGYKVYDYFTYAEYKFKNRQKKWMNQESFARSIIHSWRSLDNMSFSEQFYYVSTLMTWGIIYLLLGMTVLIRNQYNPFADPVITPFIIMVMIGTSVVRNAISVVADYFKIWEIHYKAFHKLDVAQINKLDKEYAMRVLVRNLQTNPFRHKFLRVNREWLIHNIAVILGGKNYLKHAGPEVDFLQKIYQRAVNANEIDRKLQVHFDHIREDLAVMPYNKPKEEGENVADQISDDSISDLPVYNWQIPFQITYDHIQIIAKQWIDYAKHNMRLKEMVSDIISRKLRPKCQRCKSVFRLQVIQKIQFNEMVKRYRLYTSGLPFTRARWRRFYVKNQIFITMCMECAYLDNLKMQQHKKRGNDVDENLIATNAVKHIGNHNVVVQQNTKKKYVRNIIMFWIGIARANLLHDVKKKAQRADDTDDSSGSSESKRSHNSSRVANVI